MPTRRATLADAAAMAALYQAAVPLFKDAWLAAGESVEEAYTTAMMAANLERPEYEAWVFEQAGELLGFFVVREEALPVLTTDPASAYHPLQGRTGTRLVLWILKPGLTDRAVKAALDDLFDKAWFAARPGRIAFGILPRTVAAKALAYLDGRFQRIDFVRPGSAAVWSLWWHEVL